MTRTEELKARGLQIAKLVQEERLLDQGFRGGPVTVILDTLDQMIDARIWLVDRAGLVRNTSSAHRQWRGAWVDPADVARLQRGELIAGETELPLSGPGISVAVPLLDGTGALEGAVLLHAPLRGFWWSVRNARTLTAYAGLLAVILATAAAYLFSRTLSRPLKELSEGVEAMQRGDFARRVDESPVDELGVLARAFNRLSEQLGQTVNALRQENRKVEAILNAMTEGVIAVDDKGHVMLANPAFARLTGLPQEGLIGRTVADLPELEPFLRLMATAAQQDEPVQELIPWRGLTLRFTATSLAPKAWETVGSPALSGESAPLPAAPAAAAGEVGTSVVGRPPAGAVGVLQDVTEQERLERMRRDFVANVSHDLRTPLTTLRGFLQALSEGVVDDREEARRSATVMLKETLRLIRLVNTLVDLARLQSGAVALRKEAIDVEPFLADLTVPFVARAEDKGVELSLDVPPGLPPVWADRNRLGQMIGNLLDNAVKFTRTGDKVRVSAGVDRATGMLRITVSDNGPGIAPADLPYIWERFYKGDKARASRDDSGAGLGLVIVKDLAEAHGGRAFVETAPGWTTFGVLLPLQG